MPYPKLIIYPDEYSMLEIGVRIQQLLLLHPHAVRWDVPQFEAAQYDSLIKMLWQRIGTLRMVPDCDTGALDAACAELETAWHSAVEHSFDCFFVTSTFSTIPTYINDIVRIIEQGLPASSNLAIWYRLGRYSAEGRTENGNWSLSNRDAWEQHLSSLLINRDDLFTQPEGMTDSFSYPANLGTWTSLDAGLKSLATVAKRVQTILDEPFLPTAQQSAVLKALTGGAANADELGVQTGCRRSLFARNGGRDHIYELRVRRLVAWHPAHGFYRPDYPPPEPAVTAPITASGTPLA